jgi:hypothetical protein
MYTEARTVLRAVAADFFNCLCLEIRSVNRIRPVPRRTHRLEGVYMSVFLATALGGGVWST